MANLISASAAGDGFHCALGVGIINEDAFAIGVTTILDPLADADWDGWLYHTFFDVFVNDATAGDLGAGAISRVFRAEIDSKAMRKLKEKDVIFAAVESNEQGTAVMEINFDSRMLVLLP